MSTEYAVLLPGDEDAWAKATPEEREAVYGRHYESMRVLEERGHRVTGGAELTHSREAKVVRGSLHNVTVTDGPYAESADSSATLEGGAVRYLVLMYQDEKVWAEATNEERQQVMAAHDAFDKAVRERAAMVAGEALASEGETTTLRHEQGRPVLTDGPFAESVEQLGGFYLVDADDLDTMIGLAKLLPQDYTIEIRASIDVG